MQRIHGYGVLLQRCSIVSDSPWLPKVPMVSDLGADASSRYTASSDGLYRYIFSTQAHLHQGTQSAEQRVEQAAKGGDCHVETTADMVRGDREWSCREKMRANQMRSIAACMSTRYASEPAQLLTTTTCAAGPTRAAKELIR